MRKETTQRLRLSEQVGTVEALRRKEEAGTVRWRKLTVAAYILAGDSPGEACGRAGIGRSTFFLWRRRFEEGGLGALLLEKKRGRPRTTRPRYVPPPEPERMAPPRDLRETERARPTLRDVARSAGVGVSTVSLVLRGSGRFSAKTVASVEEAVRSLGYRPDPFVSANMAYVRSARAVPYQATIAFLSDYRLIGSRELYRARVQTYFEPARLHADRLGYNLELFELNSPEMSNQRLAGILRSRGIRGLVFGPLFVERGRLDFDLRGFAAALIGYSIMEPFGLHRVGADTFNIMLDLLHRIEGLRYERIGLISPVDRRANFLWGAAMHVFNQSVAVERRVEPLLPEVLDEQAFRPWFERERPDVVISVPGVGRAWLRSMGARVPDDVGFASPCCTEAQPELSGYSLHLGGHGAPAVDLVIEQLHRNETGIPATPKTILMQGIWRDGSTLRRRVGAGAYS